MISSRQLQNNTMRSIQFIHQTQMGLSINPQALAFISTLPPKRCHILSILGRAKTGKSTLMNHLIHKFKPLNNLEECFNVSNNLGVGTKGINILTSYCELDEDNILLFLDVQGIGNLASCEAYESKLFAIALLLSTTLIYNSMGAIDEPALQSLSIFIQIGKILEKSISKQHNKEHIQLPSLFLALRDFSLKLQNKQGLQVTAYQYLQSALQEQKGGSQVVFYKNRIRRTIKEMFKNRHCHILPLPSDDLPIKLNSPLRPQFQRDLSRFFQKLNCNLRQQGLDRKLYKPNQLCIYAQEILVSISSSVRLPTYNNVLESISHKQVNAIKEKFIVMALQLLKQLESKAIDSEAMIESISELGSPEDCHAKTNIARLDKFIQLLEQFHQQKQLQIHHLIEKQRKKGINLNADEDLKALEQIKISKSEQLRKRIEDLECLLQQKQKQLHKKHLQLKQKEQFQSIIQSLCLIADEKQLTRKYNQFIYDLRNCQPINSKLFETGLLKCQVAYLRRRIELKERTPNILSQKSQNIIIINPEQLKVPKNFQIKQQSALSQPKAKHLIEKEHLVQKGDISKAFYVPYIMLHDTSMMGVEIIKTLIKQDHRLNNYIEYVLEVVIMEQRWVFNRKWKDFNQLHTILTTLFNKVNLPQFIYSQIALRINTELDKQEIEGRRRQLETYLRQLLEIEPIRNSRIMQKFLKINKEYIPTL